MFQGLISTLNTRTEMVLETMAFSPLNQLPQLVAWEYFIIKYRRESCKSYNNTYAHVDVNVMYFLPT
jgi:hypothetical protein